MQVREKLPNTSLCAIVRDEVINPAGEIADFLETILPFVEEAVVVDTGSIDEHDKFLKNINQNVLT